MKARRTLLAGFAVVLLAPATPLALPQKPGVPQTFLPMPMVSACAAYAKPVLHRTIIDEIDQPLIAIREDSGHCIATAVPPAGFFEIEEAVDDFGEGLAQEDKAMLEGSFLFGGLLLLTALATKKLRPARHRHAGVKRSSGSRRKMAVI